MTMPTLTVEIAFDDGPLEPSPDWTDVTSHVRSIETSRSLGNDLDPSPSGRATIVLDNRTRVYDPSYTAGTYYGKLLPRRQLRVRAEWDSVTYDVFRGFVHEWPQDYPAAGADSIVTLSCYDALGFLGGMRLPADVLPEIIDGLDAPWAWWRLGDTGSTVVDVSGNGRNAKVLTGTLETSSSLTSAITGEASLFRGGTTVTRSKAIGSMSGQAWTVAAWIRTSTVASVAGALNAWWNQDFSPRHPIRIGIDNDGRVQAHALNEVSGVLGGSVEQSESPVADGQAHHVVVTAGGTSLKVYVDGVDVSDLGFSEADGFGIGGSIFMPGAIGEVELGLNDVTDEPFTGELQDLIYWVGTALSASEVEDLYEASIGRIEEDATDRAIRLLDAVGWPSGLRDISTGCVAQCGHIGYNRGNVLNQLQLVEATEQGALFASKDGKITLLPRYYWDTVTEGSAVQATFSDDGSDIGYSELRFAWDAELLLNDVDVVPGDASARNSSDQTSIDAYGRRSETVNTVLAESEDAAYMAQALVNRLKDPVLRPDAIAVYPQRNADDWWPLILPLELGYRVQLERTPMGVGSQIVQAAMVQDIQHTITPDQWIVRLKASPRPLVGYFVLDTSELDTGVLGY